MPKKHQLSLASSFTLQFYVILLVIRWGKKLCIGLKRNFTITEEKHFFYVSGKRSEKWDVFRDFDCKNMIFMENKRHIRNQKAKIHWKLDAPTKNKTQ